MLGEWPGNIHAYLEIRLFLARPTFCNTMESLEFQNYWQLQYKLVRARLTGVTATWQGNVISITERRLDLVGLLLILVKLRIESVRWKMEPPGRKNEAHKQNTLGTHKTYRENQQTATCTNIVTTDFQGVLHQVYSTSNFPYIFVVLPPSRGGPQAFMQIKYCLDWFTMGS